MAPLSRSRHAGTSGVPLRHGHLHSLDGLRGLALLTVLCHHLAYAYPPRNYLRPGVVCRVLEFATQNGWLGVDVFFVLSGFLITTILLRSREAENYYSVFYERRALRLMPVYYGVLLFVFLLPWARIVQVQHVDWRMQLWWWLNCSNVVSAFAPYALPSVSLFWSLAVEEQFYLVWPTVVRRLSDGWLMGTALALVGVEVVLRVLPPVLRLTHRYPEIAYRSMPLHWDGLLLGSALSIAIATGRMRADAVPVLRLGAAGFSVAALLLLYAGARFYTTPVIALAAACAVALLVVGDGRGTLSRCLSARPLCRVGRYSYCMYATQTLVMAECASHVAPRLHLSFGWPRLLGLYGSAIAVSFGLGALSWRLVEEPINGLKRYLPYRMRPRPGVPAAEREWDAGAGATMGA